MRTVFIFIFLFTGVLLGAQESRESIYFVMDSKTGQRVELGDTLELLKERFGEPSKIEYTIDERYEPATEGYIYAYYDTFSVKLDPGYHRICDIAITSQGVETFRGLKVGDSLDDVKALFIDQKCSLDNFEGHALFLVHLPYYEGDHATDQMIVCEYNVDEVITSITVGAINWD